MHQGCIKGVSLVQHRVVTDASKEHHWCIRDGITDASPMHPRCIAGAVRGPLLVDVKCIAGASGVYHTTAWSGSIAGQAFIAGGELAMQKRAARTATVAALCWCAVILSCTVLACCHLVMLSWGSWLPFGSRLCWRLMAPACDRCIGVHHRCIMVHHRRIVVHQVHHVHHWCIEGASPVHRRSMGALQVHHRCITSECPVNQWFQ